MRFLVGSYIWWKTFVIRVRKVVKIFVCTIYQWNPYTSIFFQCTSLQDRCWDFPINLLISTSFAGMTDCNVKKISYSDTDFGQSSDVHSANIDKTLECRSDLNTHPIICDCVYSWRRSVRLANCQQWYTLA